MRPPLLRLLLIGFVLACSSVPDEEPFSATMASKPATELQVGRPVLSSVVERLRADVAWLADDAQQGRRAGTEAGKRCGEWIAARMKALGLEAAGVGGSYLQEFQVPLPVEVGPGSRVGDFTGADDVMPLFCSSGGEAAGQLEWRGY